MSSGHPSGTGRPDARAWAIIAGLVLLATLAVYGPVVASVVNQRAGVRGLYLSRMFPLAALHLAALLLVRRISRRKTVGALAFFLGSTAWLVAEGGPAAVKMLCATSLAFLLLVALGVGLSDWILEAESRGMGTSLGFGILFLSFLGSVLAAMHAFTIPAAALAIGLGFVPAVRKWSRSWSRDWSNRVRVGLRIRLRLATILAMEGIFLLGAYLWVAASPPEQRNDAVRAYLPYVRLLDHFHGFFDLPSQWVFIVPQAGVAYAAMFKMFLGLRAVRDSMPMALLALVLVLRDGAKSFRENRLAVLAVALTLASCPLMLVTGSSLMQEAFECLATSMTALVCTNGRLERPYRYGAAVGALAGIALVSKYTTIVYVAPLAAWSVWRIREKLGVRRALPIIPVIGASALAAGSPWLWHAYRESGDPFFPFLVKIFPSRLWPHGLGIANLGKFRLPPGPVGWFRWPYDMTVHTDRFVESVPGALGVSLPMLLVLAIPLLWRKGNGAAKVWGVSAMIGTGLLWTQTTYLRYLLPALWLMALPAVRGIGFLTPGRRGRAALAAVALALLCLQIPVAMAGVIYSAGGWPWDFYSGKIDEEFALHRFAGYGALRQLERIDPDWPRVWYSGFVPVGHLQAVPLEAALWHLYLHGFRNRDPQAMVRFLNSAGCDYWIVDEMSGTENLTQVRVANGFWKPEFLVASDGATRIYRMPLSERARAAVARYTTQRPPRSMDLLQNGSFEEVEKGVLANWMTTGALKSSADGAHTLRIGPGQVCMQGIQFPEGQREFVATESARSVNPDQSAFRTQVDWVDASGRTIEFSLEVARADRTWRWFEFDLCAPPGARRALVYLANQEGTATEFREVRLYAVAGSSDTVRSQ